MVLLLTDAQFLSGVCMGALCSLILYTLGAIMSNAYSCRPYVSALCSGWLDMSRFGTVKWSAYISENKFLLCGRFEENTASTSKMTLHTNNGYAYGAVESL